MQREIGPAQAVEQTRNEQRVETDARLEGGVDQERVRLPVDAASEEPAAERETAHVGGQHRRRGIRGDAEDEREGARPDDLVGEPGRAGDEEDREDPAAEQKTLQQPACPSRFESLRAASSTASGGAAVKQRRTQPG